MSWSCNGKVYATYREANAARHSTGDRVEYVHEGGTVIRVTDSPDVGRAVGEACKLSTVLGFPVQIVEMKQC